MTNLCTEPTVDDLLAELETCLLMASDRVQEADIRELLKRVTQARTAAQRDVVVPSGA